MKKIYRLKRFFSNFYRLNNCTSLFSTWHLCFFYNTVKKRK